jgi:hypothetical protein
MPAAPAPMTTTSQSRLSATSPGAQPEKAKVIYRRVDSPEDLLPDVHLQEAAQVAAPRLLTFSFR